VRAFFGFAGEAGMGGGWKYLAMTAPDRLCRDCLGDPGPAGHRCAICGSPRLLRHAELARLAIAHIDCDAFYAAIEKRDNPALRDEPVIVGGGKRGVVSTCCYVARLYGVRSAMPMFKALELCPKAVVIHPDMAKYAAVGHEVRELMLETTPLVEPLSIDEAFLDLSGTEALHHGSPAKTLARLAARIEQHLSITVSIGLSYNKFLAKVASDLDKPRGFAIIGRAEAPSFLAGKPVGLIWGVGKALQQQLAKDGITHIGQLQTREENDLLLRYGSIGRRLARFARGIDDREVDPDGPAKSISAETTFNEDIADFARLDRILWPLCEKVSYRLKRAELAGGTVTLKLKTDGFQILTRNRKLADPTQLAEAIYRAAKPLLQREANGRYFRLIGVGTGDLVDEAVADPPDLADPDAQRRKAVEQTIDKLRDKLGRGAIRKGRGWVPPKDGGKE
jgi:DNA polymerase-4